jgi:hypothetical protein
MNTSHQGIDYGPRKGTFGFAVHMTEGNGGIGDVLWLAKRSSETIAQWKTRVRGVSANFVITKDGTVYQMVGWNRASGSMNPRDRSDSSGFYRQAVIVQVLGTHYTDPNAYSISVEVAGKRADGPTDAQVKSLISVIGQARAKFPTLRGAYGHADQTDTKGCPGTHANMLRFWDTVGHGLFVPLPTPPDTATGDDDVPNYAVPGRWMARFKAGAYYVDKPAGERAGDLDPGKFYDLVAQDQEADPAWYQLDGGSAGPMSWAAKADIAEKIDLIDTVIAQDRAKARIVYP